MRPLDLPRASRAISLRIEMLRNRGDTVQCPLCASRFARFKDDRRRPNALCWRCGSHERHRAQWLLLERRPELLAGARSLLHLAPEWALERRLRRMHHLTYVTADLERSDVDRRLDLTAIDLPDECFDAVICSHVLEHIEDDRAAMTELRRITVPGGWCMVMVPLDLSRSVTYEDARITLPEEREQAFWQRDHVRVYAIDIADRLTSAGFAVERVAPRQEFGDRVMERCRILDQDQIFLCRADASSPS